MDRNADRWEDAVVMAENVVELDTGAGTGPWSRLAADCGRLQALYQQGRLEDVLAAVAWYRETMAGLADPPDDGTVAPWAVRESVLGLGVVAAHDLGRWAQALELNAAVQGSQADRRAGEAERAVTWFNDYGPLLRLGRPQEARELLYRCRVAFSRAEDITMMGNTLSALADTDAHLGQIDLAVTQETDALRLKYRGSDPETVAVSHYNLANYLIKAGQDMWAVWAHRLAAAVIRYQTDSPRLIASLQSIGRLLGQRAAGSEESVRAPLSFNDVCLAVDALPGVRFAELFAVLPDRVDGGQAVVDEVMRLTADVRDTAIQESVTAWEPIISAMVAAQQPDTAAEVAPLLADALAELRGQLPWRELVVVLSRVQAGPDHHSSHTFDNLDPISATVALRARAALAGEVTVDPNAWRALVDGA
jgi:tetratricopeptide (TPR) repeat protein